MIWWVRVVSGPLAFVVVQLIPMDGLEPRAHVAISCYAWVLTWWASTPIPWAVTGFLPLLIFPIGGVMGFRESAALYGQRILPFVVGVMLVGHAFRKHGLAQRLAMSVLSIPGVSASGPRLVLMILVVTGILSTLVDDAAAVAIMIPIALSVSRFAGRVGARAEGIGGSGETPRLQAASCLAVLYGSAAGGMGTPAGVPFNPLSMSILDQLTPYQISFGQWTLTGLILMAATIPIYFGVLMWMSPPEVRSISNGAEYFSREKKALGPMSRGEKNVVFVVGVMVVLWFLPAFVTISALDIWYVPSVGMVLLFLLPIDTRKGEMTLNARDFQDGVLWNVLFLVVSGTALASGLAGLGVTDWISGMISPRVSETTLPLIAGFVTPILSHLTSGTATTSMVSTILFPIANDLGYNAAILARIIAGTALAVSVPWAGAAAGTAFASGSIKFGTMVRIGVVVSVLTMIVVTVLSVILVPALEAYTTS